MGMSDKEELTLPEVSQWSLSSEGRTPHSKFHLSGAGVVMGWVKNLVLPLLLRYVLAFLCSPVVPQGPTFDTQTRSMSCFCSSS
jgi:hypothetical protein